MSSGTLILEGESMLLLQQQPPESEQSVLHQTYLDELLSNLINEPEDIGIKLLLLNIHPTKSHDQSENRINHNSSDDTIASQQQQQQQHITTLLRRTSVELFHHIETLHQSYTNILQSPKEGKNNTTTTTTLSGLPKLYISATDDTNQNDNQNNNNDNDTFLDAETIWGQVEIQNNALQTILKRSLRQLILSSMSESNSNNNNNDPNPSNKIQLLHTDTADDEDDIDEDDMDDIDEDDINDKDPEDDVNDDSDSNGDEHEEENNLSTDDEEIDEETKRIRDRMKRTMEEMSDEDDENDDENDTDDDNDLKLNPKSKQSDPKAKDNKDTDDDIENDPATVQLHDGFFNLQEMEEFADEEEEYLPNDAYGPISTDNHHERKTKNQLDTRSFHQKQRDGDMANPNDTDSDDDDDDADDNETLLFKTAKDDPILQRRKKYRDDEEIEALFQLYDPPDDDDDDDDDGNDDDNDDIIHMTAADLFGPPNRKFYNQWNQKNKKHSDKFDDEVNDNDDGYEDSMNDFNSSTKRKKSGWNDDDDDEDDDDDDKSDENENDDKDEDMDANDDSASESDFDNPARDDDERSDEEVPMKGNVHNKSKSSQKVAGGGKSSSKLLELTEQLERDMLAEKPWQMKGETGSSARPVNSLLESTPEFEVATKLNPIITVAHTANLEEIIKQRIIAEDWDDIVPRELPDVGWSNKKNKGELPEVSQEKSKLGLGELYEREYLKKAVGYDVDAAEKLSSEDQLKNEMKSLFANVCSKLDALSNYHFTPRPVAGDTEVRPLTVPAIAMEEVLPIHVSDARGVAPEEVYGTKKRGRDAILRDTSELDQAERKRLRNSKKSARRKERQAKLADEKLISRLEPSLGLNNPYEKRKMREELSMARAGGRVTMGASDKNDKYGTSQTFFQRLQNEAEQTIRNGGNDKNSSSTNHNNTSATGNGKSKSSKSSAYKL